MSGIQQKIRGFLFLLALGLLPLNPLLQQTRAKEYTVEKSGLWNTTFPWKDGVIPPVSAGANVLIKSSGPPLLLDLGGETVDIGALKLEVPRELSLFDTGNDLRLAPINLEQLSAQRGAKVTAEDSVNIAVSSFTLNAGGAEGILVLRGIIQPKDSSIQPGIVIVEGGEVHLLGANTHDGGTDIRKGMVVVGNDQALGDLTGDLTLGGGAVLRADDQPRTIFNPVILVGGGIVTLGGGGAESLAFYGAISLGGTRNFEISSPTEFAGEVIDGSSNGAPSRLIKSGKGTLILSAANSFSGGVELREGVLVASGFDSALGGSARGVVTVSGGTLMLTASQTVGGLQIRGGSIVMDPGLPASLIVGDSSVILVDTVSVAEVAVPLEESGSAVKLVKQGGGAVFLSAPSTFSGGAEIQKGSVIIGDSGALGTGVVVLHGGTLGAERDTSGNPRPLPNTVSIRGDSQLGHSAGSSFIITGPVDLAGAARVVTIAGTVEVAGSIGDGGASAKLTKDGVGRLVLQGNSNYSGGTDLRAGVMETFADRALGDGIVRVLDGELQVGSTTLTVSGLTILAGTVSAPGTPGASLVVQSPTPAVIEANIADRATISVALADDPANGIVGLTKTGTGDLLLSGNSMYRGDTRIKGGVVRVGADATATTGPLGAPNASGIVVLAGGMLVGDSTVSRNTGKPVDVQSGMNRLGSDMTAIRVGNTTIQSGATLETRGALETARMAVRGTWILSGATPVTVSEMEASNGARLVWSKPLASTAIIVNSNGAVSTDLQAARVEIAPTAAQSAQRMKSGSVVGTLVQAPGTLVSPSTLIQPDGRVRFSLNLRPAVGAVPGGIDLVVDRNDTERDGGRAAAGFSALWARRGTAMDEPLFARLNALAAMPPLQTGINLGVRIRRMDAKTVKPPQTAPAPDKTVVLEESGGWEVWAAGYGLRNDISADPSQSYGAARSTEGGGAVGIEKRVGDARGGLLVVVGQGSGSLDDPYAGLRVNSDYWGVGGYGSVRIGAVTLDASAMWGRNEQESTRESLGEPVRAKFSSGEFHGSLGVTLNLAGAKSPWQISPMARLQYLHISQGAFEERGGLFPAAFDKIGNERLLSKVGLRIGRVAAVNAKMDLGFTGAAYWVHDYTSAGKAIAYRVGRARFSAPGRRWLADSAMFDFGVQATFSQKLTLGLSGRQQVGADQYQTTGLFSLALQF